MRSHGGGGGARGRRRWGFLSRIYSADISTSYYVRLHVELQSFIFSNTHPFSREDSLLSGLELLDGSPYIRFPNHQDHSEPFVEYAREFFMRQFVRTFQPFQHCRHIPRVDIDVSRWILVEQQWNVFGKASAVMWAISLIKLCVTTPMRDRT